MFPNPKLTVSFERFSTAVGYGYLAQATLVHGDDTKVIVTKFLHCVFGERSALEVWHTEISPNALGALQKFCEAHGTFWGCRVTRSLSWEKYQALRRSFLAVYPGWYSKRSRRGVR